MNSKAQAQTFETVAFAVLVAGLAAAPFWLGGNRPIAWSINAIWASGLVVLYEIGTVLRTGRHPVAIGLIWPAAVAFCITSIWCLVQISTSTPAALQHPIWDMARQTLEINLPGSISVNPDATVLALLRLATAACVFWVALQLCRSTRRARLLIEAVALIGFAYALYGLVAFFVFPQTILWLDKVDYLDSLTSTFINRNSYATYAALGLLASLGVTLSMFAAGSVQESAGRQAARLIASFTGRAGAWLGITAIIAMALVLTGSRGGIVASTLGLFVGVVLSLMQRRGASSPAAVSAFFALLMISAVAVTFGDLLASRLMAEGFRSDDRLAVYGMTVTSIADRPLLGFGYGTFEHVFPMYRDASVSALFRWDKAHNTYLEVIQGLGIPVAGILFGGVGWLVWRCFLGALTRRRFVTAPLVASAASVTILAHAFVDFSLQIQGVTLTWMALLGCGVAQSWSSETNTSVA